MKIIICALCLLLAQFCSRGQGVGIGTTTPDPKAVLELKSATQGLLMPRLADTNAITGGGIAGLLIYSTSDNKVYYHNGSYWMWLNCTGASNGQVSALHCDQVAYSGNQPVAGVAGANYTATIPYDGGNGGSYVWSPIPSSNVTGLTATALDNQLSIGSGTIRFAISGTPSGAGTANFQLTLGGQNCSFAVPVAPPAAVVSLTSCGSTLTSNNTITAGTPIPAGTTVQLAYTGGNGGNYNALNFASAGVSGITASAPYGTVNNGSGSVSLDLSGTPASGPGGNAAFQVQFAGNNCQILVPVAAGGGAVTTFSNCPGVASGALTQGSNYTAASNMTITLGYTGGNGGGYAAVSQPSTGVTGLFANLAAGNFASGSGSLVFTITGTPASSGTASFSVSVGGQTCTVQIAVNPGQATVSAFTNCPGTVSGSLMQGTAYTASNNITITLNYSGGNGNGYSAQSVPSTGVTGLTATLNAGTLQAGSGSLVFNITGTPTGSGTASVTYGTIASPTTGACFLDRNLGASAVATAYNDYTGYGDLFQWGRGADGHQRINWTSATAGSPVNGTTTTLSSSDVPGNALFITPTSSSGDWRSSQNDNLWQGVSGINNPCPGGWHVPTQPEWAAETGITNYTTGYSQLKLTVAGWRVFGSGALTNANINGDYWSSSVSNGTGSTYFGMGSSSVGTTFGYRAYGFSVRCRK